LYKEDATLVYLHVCCGLETSFVFCVEAFSLMMYRVYCFDAEWFFFMLVALTLRNQIQKSELKFNSVREKMAYGTMRCHRWKVYMIVVITLERPIFLVLTSKVVLFIVDISVTIEVVANINLFVITLYNKYMYVS